MSISPVQLQADQHVMTRNASGTGRFFRVVALNCRYTHSCLALFHVRQELFRHLPDSRVEIRQLTINDPYFQTLLRLAGNRPDAVLFSVSVWNAAMSLRLARDLVAMLPEVRIVMGGPEATQMTASVLPDRCSLVRGDVEGLPAVFFDDLAKGRLRQEYQAGDYPAFVSPYRDSDFASELRHRQIYYESIRGCPFACTYCLSSVSRGVRSKDLMQVKEELRQILKHQPASLRFVDRTFNARSDRTLDLWRFLIDQPGRIEFHFEIAPDLFTDEMFDFLAMVPAGRFAFEMGIQSTNDKTLKAVNRKMDMGQASDSVSRLKQLDTVHLHVDLILGLPFETRESFRKTFNDVFRMGPHHIQMGLLKILPGTPIAEEKGFGMVHCNQPPYEIMANRWLDQASLARLYWFGECVEAFHNNRFFPATLAYVRRVEPDPFVFFDRLLDLFLARGFFDRAKTQEYLNSLLCEFVEQRPDRDLIFDLLRFDWLRNGHQFLPNALLNGRRRSLRETRDRLWRKLPPNCPPFFDYQSRDEFFRQGIFAWFSGEALREVGLVESGEGGHICFLPSFSAGVVKLRQAVVLPGL